MQRIVVIPFLMIFSVSIPCYSQELTRDALIQGVNQARWILQSGEVIAITTLERPRTKKRGRNRGCHPHRKATSIAKF